MSQLPGTAKKCPFFPPNIPLQKLALFRSWIKVITRRRVLMVFVLGIITLLTYAASYRHSRIVIIPPSGRSVWMVKYGKEGQNGVSYLHNNASAKLKASNSLSTLLFYPIERLEMALRGSLPKYRLSRIRDPNLLVEEGFELGELPFDKSGNEPIVLKSSDARSGNFMMKSILSAVSKIPHRSEVYFPGDTCHLLCEPVNFDIGKEYWIGISIKLGEDFNDESNFQDQGMLLQWHYRDHLHPEVRDAQPLLLRYADGQVHVHNEVLQEYMSSSPPDYGDWVDWVFNIKFSDVDGIIRVWRNGQLIVDFKGNNHQVEKHEGAVLKFGLYSNQYRNRKLPANSTRTVYHDELRVAGITGSYELVCPR